MARLLMIESWLQSTGLSLPPLIRRLGHEYVLMTRDPALYTPAPDGRPHPVVDHAADVVVVETNDLEEVRRAAAAVDAREPVDGVLTTCDYYLETVATVASHLGLPGSSPAVVRRATRKDLVRATMAAAGLPGPAFSVAATWAEARRAASAIGYPLVAKPVDLNSGTGVQLIADEAELKDAFWEVTGMARNTRDQPLAQVLLLEELLAGREVSVEAVTRDGATTILGITAKSVGAAPAFVETGHVFPAALSPGDAHAVESLVRDTLTALGLTHGLSHVEVMLTDAGPRVVEVNPRQGGGYIFDLVSLVTGTDPLEVLVALALGEEPRLGTAAAPIPGRATAASAAVAFVLAPAAGELVRISGAGELDPGTVVRVQLDSPSHVRPPSDNNDRLGHLLTVDPDGSGAGRYADVALGSLRIELASGAVAAPQPLGTGSSVGRPVGSPAAG